jgi:MFS family permease
VRLALDVLRHERRARAFFGAYAQSALGTGAAYVALALLAYDRFRSPWAISLVLLADFLPAVLLGPLLGAAADRWRRRLCMVAADLLRAAAFAAIAFSGSFALTLALAALAGAGTALFKPAALAALPGLVGHERLRGATSLWGAVTELGFTLGPAVAAAVMLVVSPPALLAANAVTFGVSALVLARIPFGDGEVSAEERAARGSLASEMRRGLGALRQLRDVRALILVSAAMIAVACLVNVAEMLFATDSFDAGRSGFSILVASSGAGVIVGSLAGSRFGSAPALKRYFVLAILVMGAAYLAAGVTPMFVLAASCFVLAGIANGVQITTSRVLIQTSVPGSLLGRVFGVENALVSAAFGMAFVAGGACVSGFGARAVIVGAGLGTIAVWSVALVVLRRAWPESASDAGTPAAVAAPSQA